MQYKELGNTGIEVSALSLGSWRTFEHMEEDRRIAVFKAALDAGVNFLDDARYSDETGSAPIPSGYSEVIFGELVRTSGRERGDLVLADKLWYEFYPDESPEQELDGSLARLRLDHVDLIYSVTPPDEITSEQVVTQMADLLATGKARCWGIANWPAQRLREVCRIAASRGAPLPCAAQLAYSVIRRAPVEDADVAAVCREYGIGVVASFSLEGGVLTGKYNQADFPDTLRGKREQIEKLRSDGVLDKVAQLMDVAREMDCTPAQLAFAFCLKNPQVASVLFGATRKEQITDNLGALDVVARLDNDVMTRLDRIAGVPGD